MRRFLLNLIKNYFTWSFSKIAYKSLLPNYLQMLQAVKLRLTLVGVIV